MKTNNIKNYQIMLCYPVENIFLDVVNGITDIKIDKIKYSNTIFYFNNKYVVAKYDLKNDYFYCSFYKFWLKFNLNITFDRLTISLLLSQMVEEHFKLKEITTARLGLYFASEVEEHFKLKILTIK
jgi:hypothetical protein